MTSSYPRCSQNGSSRAGGTEPASSTRLFHVHGTNEYNTKAFEVPVRAASLNSNDVFVLKTPSSCYLWYGKVVFELIVFPSEMSCHCSNNHDDHVRTA